jgi:hypothetical protein
LGRPDGLPNDRRFFHGARVDVALVRDGADYFYPVDPNTGESQHTFESVYPEMLLVICRNYPGLPDPRTLELDEIAWFYEGLRQSLKDSTKKK